MLPGRGGQDEDEAVALSSEGLSGVWILWGVPGGHRGHEDLAIDRENESLCGRRGEIRDEGRRVWKGERMKRVKMILAYDGTNYCGWQMQSNGVTIEEVLDRVLSELLGEAVTVIGASRTDSGVHAEGNVAVFDTENRMPADKICFALNQRLPEDIRVLSSQEVPPDWHPRKQNCVKTYEYRILNRKIDMPTLRLYSHFCYSPLNENHMRKAASYLMGEHDFTSFCTVRGQAEDRVRTIYRADVIKEHDMITIRLRGSGFLYNMVRIIAGTLMKVGMGVYPPEHIKEILAARNRKAAGPTAPARGLTLISLEYETELRKKISANNEDWEYQLIQTEIPEKKKAYLFINRCQEEDFDRLLSRLTHQAMRNGANRVYVCDKEEDRMVPGKAYGHYIFCHGYDMLAMRKKVFPEACGGQKAEPGVGRAEREVFQGEWEKVSIWQASLFCRIYNQIFYVVPNSATLTEQEAREYLVSSRWHLFLVKIRGVAAGFVILEEREDKLELDSFGVLKEYRGRGLAREILERAERTAVRMGKNFLSLTVSSVNAVAISLFQNTGFQNEGMTSRWYVTENLSEKEKKG